MMFTQNTRVSSAKCAHAHSHHVRDFDLKRVACVHNSFSLCTTTSDVFWEEYCCCQPRAKVMMVAGVRQQRRDVGVGDSSGGNVLAAAEMSYVVNLKVLCCRCTVTLERDGALSRLIVTAHRHARA